MSHPHIADHHLTTHWEKPRAHTLVHVRGREEDRARGAHGLEHVLDAICVVLAAVDPPRARPNPRVRFANEMAGEGSVGPERGALAAELGKALGVCGGGRAAETCLDCLLLLAPFPDDAVADVGSAVLRAVTAARDSGWGTAELVRAADLLAKCPLHGPCVADAFAEACTWPPDSPDIVALHLQLMRLFSLALIARQPKCACIHRMLPMLMRMLESYWLIFTDDGTLVTPVRVRPMDADMVRVMREALALVRSACNSVPDLPRHVRPMRFVNATRFLPSSSLYLSFF